VTYGSAIKLVHKPTSARLHSHKIQWGSGSGQQSVTGYYETDDPNSLWQVLNAYNKEVKPLGTAIPCNSIVRFLHVQTHKFLHSHLHSSPLSGRQEISGYGDSEQKQSDTGDNWRVECRSTAEGGDASLWMRGESVILTHIDTDKKLYAKKSDEFNQVNCRNCPIQGQLEVSGYSPSNDRDTNLLWFSDDGIYFPKLF